MENKESAVSFEDAKQQVTKLINRLNKNHQERLLSFIIDEWASKLECESDEGSYTAEDTMDDPVTTLNSIAKDLKSKLPLEGVLPSEKLLWPQKGENADCSPNGTLHIDEFLYTDDDLDSLEKSGKLNRNYCGDCGSKKIKPLVLVSHSTSREQLYHIFNNLLPTLDNKTVLDVGSRLGAVLYGAYVYTDARRIIGVEMNAELCDVQNETIRKYKMKKRVEVLNKRIEDAMDVVKTADVVVLNNVFEFYIPVAEQTKIWRLLRENVKKGAYIVSRPDVKTALANLDTGIVVDEWLKPETNQSGGMGEPEDCETFNEIKCYVVL